MRDFFVRQFKVSPPILCVLARKLGMYDGKRSVIYNIKLFTVHFAVRVLYEDTAPNEKCAVGDFNGGRGACR